MPDRDRRDDGRAEQSRPRDRTGRPLPYGTTGVPLTEEHDPATVDEALELGIGLWGQQRFFEAHECLEFVWHAAGDADRDLWQGVIQLAVTGVHLQRGNADGARAILVKAAQRLARYPDEHRGIDVAAARRACDRAQQELAERPDDDPPLSAADALRLIPPFPAAAGGGWFNPDPSASGPPTRPTPVPDESAWRAAARPSRAGEATTGGSA